VRARDRTVEVDESEHTLNIGVLFIFQPSLEPSCDLNFLLEFEKHNLSWYALLWLSWAIIFWVRLVYPYSVLEVSSGPKYFGLTRNQSPKPGFGPGGHEQLCDISGSGFSGLSKTSSGLDGLLIWDSG
jgi:hypothetical protein